jgi:hypothetical protein
VIVNQVTERARPLDFVRIVEQAIRRRHRARRRGIMLAPILWRPRLRAHDETVAPADWDPLDDRARRGPRAVPRAIA